MKRKMYKLTVALLLTFTFQLSTTFGQSPEKMSYQAVVRDASDILVTNQNVGMQISILQNSATGTAVYVETHTPTTNANGLVSIEIGGGTVVTGDFTAIDWAGDTYFIKTETDPAGGTAYSITGTSQLLSVPYALHAKTAENVTGTITETDPVYTTSEAANITASDISNLSNLSGTNTGDQDISGIATNTTEISANATAIQDTASQIRADIPDVSGFISTESDPVFTAWDKSTGISITESQISDLTHTVDTDTHIDSTGIANLGYVAGGITSESDPAFTASEAANITATDITNLSNLSGTNTGDQDLSTLATKTALGDSTAQIRSEIPSVPSGTTAGQMQYWNGTAWVTVDAGSSGAILLFINGKPTWGVQGMKDGDVYNPTTGKAWMDRNLGAFQVATSSTDTAAYGDLYQWGRATDGHQSDTSGITNTHVTTDTPGHGNFITNTSTPYDWHVPQNDTLWQGVSGINNPCPSGYRLPTDAEWNAERISWSSNDAAGAFASPLKLPLAGYRSHDSGTFFFMGSGGYYWSSTEQNPYSRNLYFSNDINSANITINVRTFGFSVRCIKD